MALLFKESLAKLFINPTKLSVLIFFIFEITFFSFFFFLQKEAVLYFYFFLEYNMYNTLTI